MPQKDLIVLDDVPVNFDVETHAGMLRIKEGAALDEFRRLVSKARSIGRPKAMYRAVLIESRGEDFIVAEGIKFKSRVLQVNLEKAHKIFPFVATCGVEIDDWVRSLDDSLHRFWGEAIMGMALAGAFTAVENHISESHGIKKNSYMSPGSLKDWPIEEQGPLFELLGDVEGRVGVKLTESFMMTPTKTVSGIRFPTEVDFESCMLCPMENCPGRRAKYDKDLYDKRYGKTKDSK